MKIAWARRSIPRLTMGLATIFSSVASADPVPVIEVSVDPGDSFSTLRANVAAALGPEARVGVSLAQMIDARLGRPLPEGDALAAARGEVTAAVEAYFGRGGPRESRRRLDAVIEALERDRAALESRPENLAALLRALTLRARIALEAREASDANLLLTRAARIDPTWSPDPREFPPSVVSAHRSAREAAARAPQGGLSVEAPEATCTTTLDGRSPTRGRRAEFSADEGVHRLTVRCGDQVSRVRAVTVTPNATRTVSIDPRFDAAVQTLSAPRLVYASPAEARAHADSDAAALGGALDARRVVLLDSDGLRVIDAESSRSLGALPPARAAEVVGLLSGQNQEAATPPARLAAPTDPAPLRPPPRTPSPSVAPWVVVGSGVVIAGASAVLLVLREGELARVRDLCPAATESSFNCANAVIDEANQHRATAVTEQYLAIAGFALGGAAILGGAIWYGLSRSAPGATRVTATLAPGSASIALTGTF